MRHEDLTTLLNATARITAICPVDANTSGFIRRSGLKPHLSHRTDGQVGLDRLSPHVRERMVDQINVCITTIREKVLDSYDRVMRKLPSIEVFGGQSDEQVETLVIQLFERTYGRHIATMASVMNEALAKQGRPHEVESAQHPGTFNTRAVSILESAFTRKSTLNNAETLAISQMTKITPVQVRTWFQNRRNRQRNGRPSSRPSKPKDDSPDSDPRPISSLPRRKAQPAYDDTFGTTPVANGQGRRVKAMPKRAFPPSHPHQASLSTLSALATSALTQTPLGLTPNYGQDNNRPSPAPSMARSLSAHSSASDVSSVDPSGGFSSLLINPHDAPTQVTLPTFPSFNGDMSSLAIGGEYAMEQYTGGGEDGQGWGLDFAPPQMAIFDSLNGLDFDFDLLNYDLGLAGMGMGEGIGGGMEGLSALDNLTLVATPNFTESGSTSGSPTRLPPSVGPTQSSSSLIAGGEISSADWAWAGSIAEQMAALFEGEGKNWMAEMEDAVAASASASASASAGVEESGEKGTVVLEVIEVLDEEAGGEKEEDSPSQSESGSGSGSRSKSRSVTPPPLNPIFLTTTTEPTPTRPLSTTAPSLIPSHATPVPQSAPQGPGMDFGSLSIPIPYHPQNNHKYHTHHQHSHPHPLSHSQPHPHANPLPGPYDSLGDPFYTYTQISDPHSRNTSYGSSVSSGSSVRIITPPSGEYAYYQGVPQGFHGQQGQQGGEYRYAQPGMGMDMGMGYQMNEGQGQDGKSIQGGYNPQSHPHVQSHSRQPSFTSIPAPTSVPGQMGQVYGYPQYDAMPFYAFDPYAQPQQYIPHSGPPPNFHTQHQQQHFHHPLHPHQQPQSQEGIAPPPHIYSHPNPSALHSGSGPVEGAYILHPQNTNLFYPPLPLPHPHSHPISHANKRVDPSVPNSVPVSIGETSVPTPAAVLEITPVAVSSDKASHETEGEMEPEMVVETEEEKAKAAQRAEEEERWTKGVLAFDSPCSVE